MRTRQGFLMLVLSLALASPSLAEQPIKVTLGMERTQLVAGEPIKMTVEIRNVSDHPVPVVDIREINADNQMKYTLLQIRGRNGRTQYRMNVSGVSESRTISPYYGGELLPPDGAIIFFAYPNITTSFDPLTKETGSQGATFDRAGDYDVRVAYWIPPEYLSLPPGPGKMILSNVVKVTVRKATKEEREILDALGYGNSFGEFSRGGMDPRKLSAVIEKYPNSVLIAHARFALARGLAYTRKEEAGEIYKKLMHEYPDFRVEEMHVQLGYEAISMMNWDLALSTMEDLLAKRPELANNYEVVHRYMWAKHHDPTALAAWISDRRAGKARALSSY